MKPLKLEMRAFASYGGKQEIDFTKLKDGIYLITGKTGAGKTAIFDAMMYAMYGESSGSRESKDLRSHFANSGEQTEVAFTFSHNGRVYRAERKYITDKNGNYTKTEAELYDANGKIIQSGARNVSNTVIEIVGLNLNQFKNVIMLAQGEFKKFLTSDTKEKALLLSQIFDSSSYKNFQETLNQAKTLLEEEREGEYAKIESQIEHNFKGNGYGIVLLCDDGDLLEKTDGILEKDKSSLEILSSNSKNEQKIYDNILTEKATAQKLNSEINYYNEALKTYRALAAKKTEYDKKQSELDRAEKYIRNIEPKLTDFRNSSDLFNEAKSKYEENKRLIKNAEEVLAHAQKEAEAIPDLQGKAERLKAQIEIAKAALGKYELLDDAAAELNRVNAFANEKKAQSETFQKQLDDKKSELEKSEKRLDELKDADVLERDAQDECDKAREALDALKRAAKSAAEIFNGEKAIKEAENKIKQAKLDHNEKVAAFSIFNTNFLNAKYGIIADELRTTLETEAYATCCVCGSTVTREDEARFAAVPENTPTQEQVDEANKLMQEAAEKIIEAEHNLKDLQRDFEYQKRDVLEKVQPFIPEFTDWDKLTEGGKFKAKLKEFEEAEHLAARKLSQAEINKEDRDALLKMKEVLVPQIKESENRIGLLKDELADISGKIIQLNTKIDALQKDLQFNSLKEAYADIEQKENKASELQKQISTLKTGETDAQTGLSRLSGESNALKENLTKASDRLAESEILLNNALNKFDYLSKEQALGDITRIIGEEEPEKWVNARRREIAEYKEKISAAQSLERDLFSKLADGGEKIPEKADLQEINARLAEQEKKTENAKNEEITLSNLLERRKEAFKKIQTSANKLGATDGVYQKIRRLAAIAGGRAGEKFDFERFMLGAIFKEILNAANLRLNTMSGGRYELQHSIKGSLGGGSQLGFEIEVWDMNTGQVRNPKSLSGGETFLTSLSLALGFSDIITRKSGGNKVEAMFIDEGFGSLDPSSLDTALSVLMSLTGEDYQIGIISHVDKLSESIPQKIRVSQDEHGSKAEIE